MVDKSVFSKIISIMPRPMAVTMGAALLTVAQTAPAAVLQTIGVSTQYGYGFLGTPFIKDGETLSFRDGGSVAGFASEFGLDFTTTSSSDGFFFLHNQYCVGKCTVFTLTTVTVTLINDGTDAATMRFDSQITPGHLARQGINDASSAVFDFDVTQTTSGATRTLYSADGVASAAGTNITTSDGSVFNGLTRYSNGAAWEVLDWSATNLNLLLDTIAPGETSTLTYRSMTRTATTTSECVALSGCPGVQVAFGDPRNNGGGANRLAALAWLDAVGSAVPTVALTPVIGRLYDASKVMVDIVEADAPLPATPPVLPTVTYGAPFTSQISPVPEPASWITMIVGFALLGSAVRRRALRTGGRRFA